MRLNTRIYNAQGKQISYRISTSGETLFSELGEYTEVSIFIDSVEIGFMRYSMKQDHLYIHLMRNCSVSSEAPYRHVGTLLFEYAFQKSLKAGKEGKVELDAVGASPAFYYKLGLRKKSTGAVYLQSLIAEYVDKKSLLTKNKIMQDLYYQLIKEEAAQNLRKDPGNISFEEAIEFGCYSSENPVFEKELTSRKQLNNTDCNRMHGIMYLPPDSIVMKKKEFLNFKPIGSNYFFCEATAENRLKSRGLLALMKARKIDSSNAVEIEAKIDENSLKWNILLSPDGLKMMKRNYISGWYMGVYFHNIADAQAIISPNGLIAFERGYIKHINQLVNTSVGTPALLLSNQGLQALEDGSVVISNTGYGLTDREGKYIDSVELRTILDSKDVLSSVVMNMSC